MVAGISARAAEIAIRIEAAGGAALWALGREGGGLIEFPFQDSKPGYAAGMELRIARGAFGDGDVMAWMRLRLPLIGEMDPSPLERTLVAADSGNGVSQRVSANRFRFGWRGRCGHSTLRRTRPDRPRHPDAAHPKALGSGTRLILAGNPHAQRSR